MYSELIRTRCGKGLEIIQNWGTVDSSGFSVYSCSKQIIGKEESIDISLLDVILKIKAPYADPMLSGGATLMDDAYLFTVPDFGEKFLLNCHPIAYNPDATGNFSHRPGNFINQVFVGNFGDFYPYETFGSKTLWDAQTRGEAFYYEVAPTPLPQRESLTDGTGNISLDDIIEFINNENHRDAVMRAVAFIIAQYSLPPENRKFLVIRDKDSRKIELWIAAIERAFSTRMACNIPFATRLNNFANENKYTVNLSGQYQSQIDFQNKNQKLRFKAMIVGVDERDGTNAKAVRVMQNLLYVLLDGKTCTLSANVDISSPYYAMATAYANTGADNPEAQEHSVFCDKFLPMIDLAIPSDDVLKLYSAFANLRHYRLGGSVQALRDALSILERYRLIKTPYLDEIYSLIKQGLPDILHNGVMAALPILEWLQQTASIVGDSNISEHIKTIVCSSYADDLFNHPGSTTTKSNHDAIFRSTFAQIASDYALKDNTIAAHVNAIQQYRASDWAALSEMFADCIKQNKNELSKGVISIITRNVKVLYDAGDFKHAGQAAELYAEQNHAQITDILFANAASSQNKNYVDFLVQVICSSDVFDTDLNKMYLVLKKYNLEGSFTVALEFVANSLTSVQDVTAFINGTLSEQEFRALNLTEIFRILDGKLALMDKTARGAAGLLQEKRPHGAVYANSAHIYALEIFDEKSIVGKRIMSSPAQFTNAINNLAEQNFPSFENNSYCNALMDGIFDKKISYGMFAVVADVIANSGSYFYIRKLTERTFQCIDKKNLNVFIAVLFDSAHRLNNAMLKTLIIDNCAGFKHFKKDMHAIRATIEAARLPGAEELFREIIRNPKIVAAKAKSDEPTMLEKMGATFKGLFLRNKNGAENDKAKARVQQQNSMGTPVRRQKAEIIDNTPVAGNNSAALERKTSVIYTDGDIKSQDRN